MVKRKEPAFFTGHTFHSKLVIPGLHGGQKWEFKLTILGLENGKYICRIEEYVIDPNRAGPSSHAKLMIGKKLRLGKREITRGTDKTPNLFD